MRRPDSRPLSKVSVILAGGVVVEMAVISTDVPCRFCRAPILFVETPKGNKMPVNRDPEPNGVRLSHFATCPAARSHRHAPQRKVIA